MPIDEKAFNYVTAGLSKSDIMVAQGIIETYEAAKTDQPDGACRESFIEWEELYFADKKKYPSSWEVWQAVWNVQLKREAGRED